ncbi:hypothetical protein D1BOALGB6SA_6764 [Olavius sp. associated proteobacterium Delta 1]|nr:hypothetical protein D1BOALGB6SA_6764 [Olavius sp. associated proteobacterium Delta 1]
MDFLRNFRSDVEKLFTFEELRSGSRRKEVSSVRAMIAIGLVKKQGVRYLK